MNEESRLRLVDRERKQVRGPNGLFVDAAFCVSCGKPMGVAAPAASHLLVTCDDCEKYGSVPMPALPEAPASVPRCRSCGAVGSDLGPPDAIYICDACCAAKGDPPGLLRIPETKG